MNPVSASVRAPSVPQVNLLPPEVEARRAQNRIKVKIVVGLVLFVLVLVAAWLFTMMLRQTAEADLQTERDRRPGLAAQLAEYDYINELVGAYDNSINARMWAGSSDIDWATQLAALMLALPDGVALTNIEVTQGTPYGPAASDGSVYSYPDMGILTFTGQSAEPVLPADFIEAIDPIPGFDRTWVDSERIDSGGSQPIWEYSGSVRITYNALSGRIESEQPTVPPAVLEEIFGPTDDAAAGEDQ